MKTASVIFGILILIVAAVIIVYKPAHAPTGEMPAEPAGDAAVLRDGTYCFARTQIATPDAPYAAEESMSLTFSGTSVMGTKSGTQSGPDMTNGYSGTLSGTRSDGDLRLAYAYTVEGSSATELELYMLTEQGIDKVRYALEDDGEMLVPDMTSSPSIISYQSVECR